MEQHTLKNVSNCLNTNIYSGGQSSNLFLNVVHFSTPGLIRHLWRLKTVVFLHWCLICAILLLLQMIGAANRRWGDSRLGRFKATTKINKWSSLLRVFTKLSITELSMSGLFVTHSINKAQNKWHSALQHSVLLKAVFYILLCWMSLLWMWQCWMLWLLWQIWDHLY